LKSEPQLRCSFSACRLPLVSALSLSLCYSVALSFLHSLSFRLVYCCSFLDLWVGTHYGGDTGRSGVAFLVGDTKQQGRMYYPLPFSFHQTQGYYRFVVRLHRHTHTHLHTFQNVGAAHEKFKWALWSREKGSWHMGRSKGKGQGLRG